MRIGIDLGGTHIAGGLVDHNGKLIEQMVVPTLPKRGVDSVVEDIILIIEQLKLKAVDMADLVEAVGIGVPGLVDAKGEIVLNLVNLNWTQVPLKAILEKRIGLPVYLENDANAAAFAEWHSGALKDVEVGLLVTLGTGIGGGIILGHKLYRGRHGLGEFGHMVIAYGGRQCACGLKGCFEAYASATGLVKTAEELLAERSTLSGLRALETMTPKDIVDFAKADDAIAKKAFEMTVDYLALGINNLINILDPDCVAIGGGLAYSGEFLMTSLQKALTLLSFDKSIAPTPIRFAHYLNDAGVIGAALVTYQ